jgi:hypothetical protein
MRIYTCQARLSSCCLSSRARVLYSGTSDSEDCSINSDVPFNCYSLLRSDLQQEACKPPAEPALPTRNFDALPAPTTAASAAIHHLELLLLLAAWQALLTGHRLSCLPLEQQRLWHLCSSRHRQVVLPPTYEHQPLPTPLPTG